MPATLTHVNERLVWIDCEMTGLDLRRDALIEVAAIVTDADLMPLDDGLDVIIHTDDDVLDHDAACRARHARVVRPDGRGAAVNAHIG